MSELQTLTLSPSNTNDDLPMSPWGTTASGESAFPVTNAVNVVIDIVFYKRETSIIDARNFYLNVINSQLNPFVPISAVQIKKILKRRLVLLQDERKVCEVLISPLLLPGSLHVQQNRLCCLSSR